LGKRTWQEPIATTLRAIQKGFSRSARRIIDTSIDSGNVSDLIPRDEILPAAAGRKNKPTGYNGVNHPSLFCITIHVWVSLILHDELGLVKDWLTLVEKFCDTRIETLPNFLRSI
jgi:hypothetical protein